MYGFLVATNQLIQTKTTAVNTLMMWTDFIDVMNFIFIANDMWMLWTAFVLGAAFVWKIKK